MEGVLKTILQFYQDGILDKAAGKKKMQVLLGKGFDDLVKEYLSRIG